MIIEIDTEGERPNDPVLAAAWEACSERTIVPVADYLRASATASLATIEMEMAARSGDYDKVAKARSLVQSAKRAAIGKRREMR